MKVENQLCPCCHKYTLTRVTSNGGNDSEVREDKCPCTYYCIETITIKEGEPFMSMYVGEPNWAEIMEYALSTDHSESDIAEHFQISDWDIEEKLNEQDLWRCDRCHTWFKGENMDDSMICIDCAIWEDDE